MSRDIEAAVAPWAMPRPTIVQALYCFGIVNGLAGYAVRSILDDGMIGALGETFNISMILVAAVVVALRLARHGPERAIDAIDVAVWAVYVVAVMVPHSGVSWIAVTALAGYEGLRGRHSVETVAAASLILAAATSQLWGMVILHLFAPYLLAIDAKMAATVLGLLKGGDVVNIGNLVEPRDGQSLILIAGCSSFYGLSYAFLCWLTVVRAIRPQWQPFDLTWAATACACIIAVNVFRIALMGLNTTSYFILHGALGSHAFNVLVLLLAGGAGFATLARGANAVDRAV
jgi:hypothetical protein